MQLLSGKEDSTSAMISCSDVEGSSKWSKDTSTIMMIGSSDTSSSKEEMVSPSVEVEADDIPSEDVCFLSVAYAPLLWRTGMYACAQ